MPNQTAQSLDDLRRQIDRIDAEIHTLLMRRGDIIQALTQAKRGREGGAFRPDREADMMRRLVDRHRGTLPLTTIEHLWREIISTFTQLQSPYAVHLAPGNRALALADLARFYFGFATPMMQHVSATDVVKAVAGSRNDLGLVPLEPAGDDAWWTRLGAHATVIARLPFLRLAEREARTPSLVISRPLPETRPFDIEVLWIEGDGVQEIAAGTEILAGAADRGEHGALLAIPSEGVEPFLSHATLHAVAVTRAGGYFSPIELSDRGRGAQG